MGVKGVKLESLSAPNIVGEMSFMDGQPRSATVQAAGDVEALVLRFNVFHKLMVEKPIAAFEFLFSAGRLISFRLSATTDQLILAGDPMAFNIAYVVDNKD